MELHDRRTYYRAFQSHDARFDGRVFVGVTSTGIYCRPICPARPPKFENCRFFASAAAAQEAGFRPCLRCRPEIAPNLAFWRGTANTVSRAVALIADGALDGEHSDVEALAERLGVGGRQLRRLFQRRGSERQYCFGALTRAPSFAAACHGQRGSYSMARASEIASASPLAIMASACSGSVIRLTAIVGSPTSALTRRA